jgi:hypothetical protein
VDGRGSITATSFKRGTGGVIFFTVFIRTSNPGVVEARIVELPAFSSSVGDAVLTDPQPCGNGEQVGFDDAENLEAQLSVAPPAGCSNPLDPVTPPTADAPTIPEPPAAAATTQTPSATSTVTPISASTTTSATTAAATTTTTSAATTTAGEATTTTAASPPPSGGCVAGAWC